MPKSGVKSRSELTQGKGRGRKTAASTNAKRHDYFPKDLKKKGNKGGGKGPSSSSMPTGRASHARHTGSVGNEPARQRRLGKDVTPSGPKPRNRKRGSTKKR